MRSKKVFKIAAIAFLGIAICFSGCKKNKLNKQTTSAEDNALAESMFDDIFNTTEKFDNSENSGSNKTYSFQDTCFNHNVYSCVEICIDFTDTTNFTRTVTVDFGTSGCTTGDGRVRKGKVIANRTGKYMQQGSSHVVTTDGYYVDDYKVDGTRTVTNLGKNAAGQLQFSVVVDGTITTPDNETITWTSTRTRTWTEGATTWIFGTLTTDGTIDSLYWMGLDGVYDDVWEITGSASGINREGRAFDADITTALKVQWCAPYIEVTKGVIELQPEDLKLRTVDFGDGSCDNTATASVGNKSTDFKLRK